MQHTYRLLKLIGEPAMILIGTDTVFGRLRVTVGQKWSFAVGEPATTYNGGEPMSVTFRSEDILSLEWYPQHSHATIILR
jgi:hypothetical protein